VKWGDTPNRTLLPHRWMGTSLVLHTMGCSGEVFLGHGARPTHAHGLQVKVKAFGIVQGAPPPEISTDISTDKFPSGRPLGGLVVGLPEWAEARAAASSNPYSAPRRVPTDRYLTVQAGGRVGVGIRSLAAPSERVATRFQDRQSLHFMWM
jgi:hypothetical protein